MKQFFYAFVVCFLFVNCNAQEVGKVITTKQLKTLLVKEKIQLVDVRTPEETEKGFIKTTLFSNYFATNFLEDITSKLDKDKPVYLYCRSGNRSGKACKILQEKGYEVYNVLGGFKQWKKENTKN